jgi:tRNA-dihydrouridine synthase B
MIEYTGVDGIMIGRATLGNPWIFREIISYLETGKKLSKPSDNEKLEIIMEHIKLAVEEKGENVAVKEMRKHISAYTKNMSNSTVFRNSINKIDNIVELEQAIKQYFEILK